jgi:hypothetical protein
MTRVNATATRLFAVSKALAQGVIQLCWVIIFVVHIAAASNAEEVRQPRQGIRPASIADSIRMRLVGNLTAEFDPKAPPASFSPNGKQVLILTRKGNIEKDAIDYELLLFRSDEVFNSPRARTLLARSSFNNAPAIDQVLWLNDRSILFIGQDLQQHRQVYQLDVQTNRLQQLTRQSGDVLSFDVSRRLEMLAYLVRDSSPPLFNKERRLKGLVVAQEPLHEIMSEHQTQSTSLYLKRRKRVDKIEMSTAQRPIGLKVSPDGHYVVVRTEVGSNSVPGDWKQYSGFSEFAEFPSYELVDSVTRVVWRLLNAPSPEGLSSLGWSSDSKFVVLGGTLLPLDVADPIERDAHLKKQYAVEINVASGTVREITTGKYTIKSWNPRTDVLVLEQLVPFNVEGKRPEQGVAQVVFRRLGTEWRAVDPEQAMMFGNVQFPIDIEQVQGINTPPRLFAVDNSSGRKTLLLDLNPQFSGIQFGEVQEISFRRSDGIPAQGGLYLPLGFTNGQRYPLVIQTHGWNRTRFAIDGESTAGYGAQALAGSGFVVAQLPLAKELSTPKEGPANMAMYEGLIDELERRELIDRNRVGIQGWSRTGYSVRYTLAFSKYSFAAAALIDSMDAGYGQYLSWASAGPSAVETYEQLNDAVPFGSGLQTWTKNAPSFNLARVTTPVKLVVFSSNTLIDSWEWYAGSKRLGKPVEMQWLPDSYHWPIRPSDRMQTQQGTVDWFRFWLQGYERTEPIADAEETSKVLVDQYARWEKLCDLQIATDPDHPRLCVSGKR